MPLTPSKITIDNKNYSLPRGVPAQINYYDQLTGRPIQSFSTMPIIQQAQPQVSFDFSGPDFQVNLVGTQDNVNKARDVLLAGLSHSNVSRNFNNNSTLSDLDKIMKNNSRNNHNKTGWKLRQNGVLCDYSTKKCYSGSGVVLFESGSDGKISVILGESNLGEYHILGGNGSFSKYPANSESLIINAREEFLRSTNNVFTLDINCAFTEYIDIDCDDNSYYRAYLVAIDPIQTEQQLSPIFTHNGMLLMASNKSPNIGICRMSLAEVYAKIDINPFSRQIQVQNLSGSICTLSHISIKLFKEIRNARLASIVNGKRKTLFTKQYGIPSFVIM